MAKRQQFSPFDALKKARQSEQVDGDTARQLDGQTATPVAKSKNDDFLKFTTYVRKRTHRAVKARLVEQGREMSDLVEELLIQWLEQHGRPSV